MRVLLRCWLVVGVVACGPTKQDDPYAVQTNEWDDVPAALSCNPNDPRQNCLEPKAETVRIDDEAKAGIESASFDEMTKTLTVQLKPGVNPPERVKVGSILYRGRRDRPPLLHRVDELTRSGRTVSMKLSPVKLKEAFSRGRIRTRIFLQDPSMTGAPLTGEPGKKQQPLEFSLGPSNCAGTVIDGVLPPLPGQVGVGQITLELTKCKFRLGAWIDFILEWDSGVANLDKLELSVGGSAEESLHARLRAIVANGAIGREFRIWEGPEIPVVVGGIPITINPSLFAGFNVSAEADLTVEQGFDATQSLEVGFGYSDRLDWYSIDESQSTFTEFGPNVTFQGRVNAKAYLLPRLDVKALGIVGATVDLKAFAEAKLSSTASGSPPSGELCRSLDVGFTPSIGAVVEVVGVQLLRETFELGTVKFALVRNACTPFTGNVPTSCDPVSRCCLDAQCPITEPGTTAKCKKGAATQQGLFRYACETVYPERYCTRNAQCDDSMTATDDVCEDYSCKNVLLSVERIAVGTQSTAAVSLGCTAPSCCHEASDCADGSGVKKKCEKPAGASVNDTGTCRNR